MDNLYKCCSVLKRMIRQGIPLPLRICRDTLSFDAREIDSDVKRFEMLYQQRDDLACCKAAIALYAAPYLYEEYYDWIAPIEAYYDMRYMELLELVIQRLTERGAPDAAYYQALLDAHE